MPLLSHDGAHYFGVLSVTTKEQDRSDFGWVVGLRNSHDQMYPAGLVADSHVLFGAVFAKICRIPILLPRWTEISISGDKNCENSK